MTPTSNEQPTPDAIGTWLKQLALVAGIALMACCSWLVWRISMVAYQVESSIVAISADVKQMSSSGAQISEHLQKLDDRLKSIEQKASDAMNIDEFEHLLDEVAVIRNGQPSAAGKPSPDTEREIKHLLSQIRRSDSRFTYSVLGSEKSKSGTALYIQLYAKYKTFENAISSAEDFIEKVATSTIGGQPYQVVISSDQTVALSDWLTEELKRFRDLHREPTGNE